MKSHEAEIELRKNEKPSPEQERINRKLKKHRIKYTTHQMTRIEPWGKQLTVMQHKRYSKLFVLVPTQKMPRPLTTSASACKKLMKKAELMGVNAASLEFQEAQV